MRRIITMLLALTMLSGLAVALPVTATADTGQSCAQELKLQVPTAADATAKTPVILVHGLWGDNTSLKPIGDSLGSLKSVVPYAFNYKSANNLWVTDGDTAQRLAKTIVCFSQMYDGKKVIIIAHSMGGLLTRAALAQSAYGIATKQRVGHIITIGTPHKGSPDATAVNADLRVTCDNLEYWFGSPFKSSCEALEEQWAVPALRLNSPELAALPRFPAGITVHAIAGEVKLQGCAPWGCSVPKISGGDLLVPVTSATDEYTSTGVGDGKRVFTCTSTNNPLPIMNQAWCEHNNMLKSPEVQSDVKASIQAYLTSLQPKKLPLPPHTEYNFFTRFTLPFLNTWDTSMSEPNSVLNVVDRYTCNASDADCEHIYFIDLTSPYGKQTYGSDPVGTVARESCTTAGQELAPLGPGQSVTVGGVAAQYYPEIMCANGQGYSQAVWYVPSKQLLVTSPSEDVGPSFDYDGLRAVLDNIEWHS